MQPDPDQASTDRAARLEAEALAARLEAILASTLDPIIVIDDKGTIQTASDSIERVMGFTPQELVGQNVSLLMPEPHQSRHDSYLHNFRRTGKTNILNRSREFEAKRKDGTTFPIELLVARTVLPTGQVLFTGIIHDISVRRAAERVKREHTRALERSNQELERFAYVASHDLQEPLRMVSSYLQLIERRHAASLNDEGREFLAYAVDGAERMRRLIRDLLEYSRVHRGNAPMEHIALADIINAAIRALEVRIRETNARITITDQLPVITASPSLLTQLIQNLLANALKFTREGVRPEIRIEIRETTPIEDNVHIAIVDNGIGIEPGNEQRIFGIFNRLHTRDAYEGTGIGLAMCRKIVEIHAGRIWTETNTTNGATFHITLPTKPPPAPADSPVDAAIN